MVNSVKCFRQVQENTESYFVPIHADSNEFESVFIASSSVYTFINPNWLSEIIFLFPKNYTSLKSLDIQCSYSFPPDWQYINVTVVCYLKRINDSEYVSY